MDEYKERFLFTYMKNNSEQFEPSLAYKNTF